MPKAIQLNNSGTRSEVWTPSAPDPHPYRCSVFLEAGLLLVSLPRPRPGVRPPQHCLQLQPWTEATPPIPREGGTHPLLWSGTLDSPENSGILAHEGIWGPCLFLHM